MCVMLELMAVSVMSRASSSLVLISSRTFLVPALSMRSCTLLTSWAIVSVNPFGRST